MSETTVGLDPKSLERQQKVLQAISKFSTDAKAAEDKYEKQQLWKRFKEMQAFVKQPTDFPCGEDFAKAIDPDWCQYCKRLNALKDAEGKLATASKEVTNAEKALSGLKDQFTQQLKYPDTLDAALKSLETAKADAIKAVANHEDAHEWFHHLVIRTGLENKPPHTCEEASATPREGKGGDIAGEKEGDKECICPKCPKTTFPAALMADYKACLDCLLNELFKAQTTLEDKKSFEQEKRAERDAAQKEFEAFNKTLRAEILAHLHGLTCECLKRQGESARQEPAKSA